MSRGAKALDAWLAEQSTNRRQGYAAEWLAWPDAALEEVRAVLKLNDAGKARVSMPAMVGRLRDAHGVSATRHNIMPFLRSLGRSGWTK